MILNNVYQITRQETEHVLYALEMLYHEVNPDSEVEERAVDEALEILRGLRHSGGAQANVNEPAQTEGSEPESEDPVETAVDLVSESEISDARQEA